MNKSKNLIMFSSVPPALCLGCLFSVDGYILSLKLENVNI
nr:MAG TPA: hypothetical protein [Caudoviricetes sp.]